ncbi:hypothetical protein [Streptomyces pacificus]|uniref:hypothetical protein n=1 Tax=Streptomyces pacificus TaxID=2705029 RepID=UPI0020B12548|nr:hypothetical protein [Streptomyces pacificus]
MRTASIAGLVAAAATASLLASPAHAHSAELATFRLGIQLADDGGASQFGQEQFTNNVKFGNSVSAWAGDANKFDPDAVRLNLETNPGDPLIGRDFRIGAQAMDKGSHLGPVQYTPWASAGGGQSDFVTDDNGWDPDEYRLFLDTRAWPSSASLVDFRISVTAVDKGVPGVPAFTPWAGQGGGRSPLALDTNGFDFDGFVLGLEVR